MTDFESHEGQALKVKKAFVDPESKEDTAFAKKVVFKTENFGDVTFKPRYETEEEKKINGVPVVETVEKMYAIARLPEEITEIVHSINDADGMTLTATVGEAINEGNSSYFISKGNFDTIDTSQDTIFDPEDETAEEMAEKEVNA